MRLRLDISYDGSGFHGWAKQHGLRTVQGEIESALDTILRTTGTSLTVAGRTDAGVHATGQVAHVDLTTDEDPQRVAKRLNGVLEADVRIRRVQAAPEGFDARFSAIWRRYTYRIAPGVVEPLQRGYVVGWKELDVERMNQAASTLLGTHDFAAFCKKREGATTIRQLLELSAREADGIIETTVRADAFCHSMVRALMGCLVAVGEGRRDPQWAAEVLRGKVRDPSVTVMPAHGLTLAEVGYPAAGQYAARAAEAKAVRTLEESGD